MNLSCYTKSPERQCPSTPESCKPRGKKTIHTAKIIKKPKKKILLILIVLLLGGNYKYSCQDIYQACVLGPGDIQGTWQSLKHWCMMLEEQKVESQWIYWINTLHLWNHLLQPEKHWKPQSDCPASKIHEAEILV